MDNDTRSREDLEKAAGELNVEFKSDTSDDDLRSAVEKAEKEKEDNK